MYSNYSITVTNIGVNIQSQEDKCALKVDNSSFPLQKGMHLFIHKDKKPIFAYPMMGQIYEKLCECTNIICSCVCFLL